MVSLEQVKDYLRIPYADEDSFIESVCIQAGYDYLEDAVDDFQKLYESNEKFARQADTWVLTEWVPKKYDMREGNLEFKPSALMQKLQTYVYEEVSESEN